MKNSLTSRDRVNRAIERKPHDRVPRHETFWGDTINRWEKEGLQDARNTALQRLGSDMCPVSPFLWPAPFPGLSETISETANTRMVKDMWGATTRVFKDHQTTPEHIGWDCDSPEKWHAEFKPAILKAEDDYSMEPWLESFATCRKEEKWGFLVTAEPFEFLRKIIGDEEMLVGIKDDPEWIRDISQTTTDRTLTNLQKFDDAGIRPDGVWIYGDMAFNHSTFCSPADYRELIWPDHKRLCDWAHERGLKTIYHTDGNVNGVIDLFIEAGVDILQPLESKAGMDIRNLVPSYGEQLSFFGNINVMVLIKGDLDEIEEEIKTKFAAGMRNNGYIYHSDHSIPPQVSWELYQKIIALVHKYGNY